jgi:hypothetical protein
VTRVARRLTWALLALTVAGNAAHQGLAAAGMVPPWWVAVLVGRGTDSAEPQPARPMTEDDHPIDNPSDVPPPEDRATQLITAGAGRRKLAAELGITEHRARALLACAPGSSQGRSLMRDRYTFRRWGGGGLG